MKTSHQIPARLGRWLAVAAGLAMTSMASAQITNWVAYNDHRPSTTPLANGWAITAPNVTGYNMGAPADPTANPLTDFRTGNPLTATVSFAATGPVDDFGARGRPLATNTPMGRMFYGICDLSNDGVLGVRAVPPNTTEAFVTVTFGGLDPAKRYIFRGSDSRNGGYGTRWSVATISAEGWTDAHINGAGGPGVLTANNFPTAGFTAPTLKARSSDGMTSPLLGMAPSPSRSSNILVRSLVVSRTALTATLSAPWRLQKWK